MEARLEREIEVLDVRHGGGFVVRLHVLGDFYSVEYVGLWRRLLRQYPTLRVFGYTARIDAKNYLIAAALASAADEFGWDEVFGAVGVRADDQSRPAIESGMVFNFVIEPFAPGNECRFNCRRGEVKEPDFRGFVIVRRNVAETARCVAAD